MPKPERPKITAEHQDFGRHVLAIALDMSAFTVQRIVERFGTPPDDIIESLKDNAAYSIYFANKADVQNSRLVAGDIAGSDSFSFHGIDLPDEATGPNNPLYPGRIIHVRLDYGAQNVHDYQLYSGQETPPLMVSSAAIAPFVSKFSSWSLKSLSQFQELGLGETAFHYPTADELVLIRNGLGAVYEDINLRNHIEACNMSESLSASARVYLERALAQS